MSRLTEIDVIRWSEGAGHLGCQYGYYTMYDTMLFELGRHNVYHRAGAPIVFQMPVFFPRDEGREEWIYALAETSALPKHQSKRVAQADHLICPNETVASWFRGGGIEVPIHICPLGYDPIYTFRARDDTPDKLRILWLGSFTNRKMWVYGLKAFWEAFDPDDMSVELYIKTTMDPEIADEQINLAGNVIFDNRDLSRDALHELYHSAHIFLHTCALEGFGFPPLEAMATGALVMSVVDGGLETHIHPDTAVLIPTVYGNVIQQETCWLGENIATVHRQEVRVCKPNISALAELLRWAASDYASTADRRKRAALWAREHLSWPVVVPRLIELIEEHSSSLNGGYVPRTDPKPVPWKQLIHIFDPEVMDELPNPLKMAELGALVHDG